MSDDGNSKPTKTWYVGREPGPTAIVELTTNSIQEALRVYFQQIRNEDPHYDFYAMYKRESVK